MIGAVRWRVTVVSIRFPSKRENAANEATSLFRGPLRHRERLLVVLFCPRLIRTHAGFAKSRSQDCEQRKGGCKKNGEHDEQSALRSCNIEPPAYDRRSENPRGTLHDQKGPCRRARAPPVPAVNASRSDLKGARLTVGVKIRESTA